jgi:hypothetical protein
MKVHLLFADDWRMATLISSKNNEPEKERNFVLRGMEGHCFA